MVRVLYALAPVFFAGIYYFGWRVAGIVAVSAIAAFVTEWVMAVKRNGKVSLACFVTAALYALSLPPATPFWIVAVGVVVAILFGKEVFGGFGKNVFNPAIVGRGFVYVCFPLALTSRFIPVFSGFPGGFVQWSYTARTGIPQMIGRAGLSLSDAVTAATPMWARRDFGFVARPFDLFFGSIGSVFSSSEGPRVLAAGSIGEICVPIILVAAIYLVVTKTAQWRLMAGMVCGAVVLNLVLRNLAGLDGVPPLWFTLTSGGLLYAAVFMVTDPVSAPKLPLSQWIYAVLVGMLVVFFRYKAVFAGGVAFSILMGNMCAPSLDLWIKRYKSAHTRREGAS